MLEVISARAAVISCHAEPACLDGMLAWEHVFVGRVAPDEVFVIGARCAAPAILAHATSYLQRVGSSGIALDLSGGWSVRTVIGDHVDDAWARLSTTKLPPRRPAFVQGAIASVPGKAIALGRALHLCVPSPVGHHLDHRIMDGARALSPRAVGEREFVIDPWLEARAGPPPSMARPWR